MTLMTLSLILFLIMDPIGSVSTFLRLVNDIPKSQQRYIIIRELLIALAFMLFFNYLGEWLFHLLSFCETGLRIASGMILFLVAIKILFPSEDSPRANLPAGEPFIFPLAIPLIAGPALLATIMLYAHLEPSQPLMLGAILISWSAAAIVLLSSSFLQRVLTSNGLIACERLTGMVLVLIAIQRFADGVQLFITGRCG